MTDRPCFLANLLTELAEQLSLSATRDWLYIQSRMKHEGVSFLTISLPLFARGLETALERGYVLSSDFPAFARRREGCLPKFLSGFMRKVFHDDGLLKGDCDPDAIYAIRQVSLYYKKAKLVCSKERIKKAELQYIATDMELGYYDHFIENSDNGIFDRICRAIVVPLEKRFDTRQIRCGHGPGATAERLSINDRRRIRQWPIRAEPYFPYSWHSIPNIGWISELRKVQLLSPAQEPPVRVVFVPKTLKTPRVIAVEPSHMQYMQQGLLRWIVPLLEKLPLTRGSLHFSDQSINRKSAETASVNLRSATLDLSEASDRVSLKLVQRVFRSTPKLLGALESCRSQTALTPNGTLIQLNKFASMGSAMCFPIEALCFYVILLTAIHKSVGIRPSSNSIKTLSRYLHVYGDDLIVPVAWLKAVVEELEAFGLKVNVNKSFSVSNFRESCGGDYFKGYNVKPLYHSCDPLLFDKRLTISEIKTLSEHSNHLYDLGLWKTSQSVRDFIESRVRKVIPIRSYETGGIYFKSFRANTYNHWHTKFQRPVSKAISFRSEKKKDDVSSCSIASLTIGLQNIGNPISIDLTSSVRRYSLRQKSSWIA